MELKVEEEIFPTAGAFTISRGSRTEIRVVTVTLRDDVHVGRGECVPYARYDETVDSVMEEIRGLSQDLKNGLNRQDLQSRLPAGAARNGLDCAFWDLEARREGKPVWQLAGMERPKPLVTAYTLSLAEPASMLVKAGENAHRPLLKVKLGTDGDLERIEAVREGAPDAAIIVDANEGWSVEQYHELAPQFVHLGVAMVEQPLPAGQDDALKGIERPLPVCADESCHDRASLPSLEGKYDLINIKVDKTGGLTEAFALEEAARQSGYGIMVGCMLGTSLAMAPAFLLAQQADYVDLDGPLLLAADREPGFIFDESVMAMPENGLWG